MKEKKSAGTKISLISKTQLKEEQIEIEKRKKREDEEYQYNLERERELQKNRLNDELLKNPDIYKAYLGH
jgi:hypothetical protein